jgi:hypothetical protein
MGKAKSNKLYRTFVKGLITEAGFLTYPEDSSQDELNTILSRKGNRSRRLGIDYEAGGDLNFLNASDDVCMKEFVWNSVNNDPNVTFLCLQVGSKVHFFRMNNEPLSTQKAAFVLDLAQYKIPMAPLGNFGTEFVDFSAGLGLLFIAHRYMDPVHVEYYPATDTIVAIPIVIQIRDFEGVYDGLANDEEPYNLSPQHHYNLLNQGWVTPGTRPVDISTPTYPGIPSGGSDVGGGGTGGVDGTGSGSGSGGGSGDYYDPYTGETRPRRFYGDFSNNALE